MTTDYDPIAEQYKRSKQQPWRTHVEAFSLLALIGDPRGLSVIDLACGEGFYTRTMRNLGAAAVTGIDLSAGMIELARAEEARLKQGIDYRVGDARRLAPRHQVDLVVAAYLLNYARDRSELQEMCQGIAGCLKPGGRFITVNCHPGLNFPAAPSYRQYGFEVSVPGAWQEGAPIRWTFHLPDGSFEIENYHLDVAAHEQALTSAGFQSVRWHKPRLSPAGEAGFERGFWAPLLDHPPMVLIECVK